MNKALIKWRKDVLSLGLNFAITPHTIPREEIVARTEGLARNLGYKEGNNLRSLVQRCLQEAKTPASNLSREHRKALKSLKTDPSIVVLPADKGNATVVMPATTYAQKAYDILSDGAYRKISRDPTRKVERQIDDRLKELEKSGEITNGQRKRVTPRQSALPRFYGTPKIHKEGIPLRPIVSTIGSATYWLAKELTRILSPLMGNTDSYIANSAHFVQRIKGITVDDNDILVSFDVESLFTRVPIEEALVVMSRNLQQPFHLCI